MLEMKAVVKERAIGYRPEMVLARQAGRKLNTRRLIKDATGAFWDHRGWKPVLAEGGISGWATKDEFRAVGPQRKSPFGIPGDYLWVRENYAITDYLITRGIVSVDGFYLADLMPFTVSLTREESVLFAARKRKCCGSLSGRFMYRSLSRGLDEVVSVRAERVQDITEGDARDEGVKAAEWFEPAGRPEGEHYHVDGVLATRRRTCRNGFATIWERIHGPGAWERNEWVWVVKFRKIL